MNIIVLIAKDHEKALIPKVFQNEPVLVTGVGAINVLKALRTINLKEDDLIVNVGYCGATKEFEIGKTYPVRYVATHHLEPFDEELIKLDSGDKSNVLCLTSSDFVKTTKRKYCLFDMELAFIVASHPRTIAFKTVSDHLSIRQYKEKTKNGISM